MNKEFTELASVCDNIANSDTIEDNIGVRDMDTNKSMDVEDNTETGPESEEISDEDFSEDESDPEYQPKETLKEKSNTTAEDSTEDNQILQSRDWKLLWSSSPYPKKPGRGSVKNKLKLKPGPTTYASCHAKNIKSCFQLFMPNSIENIIMHMTNMEGKRLYQDSWNKLDRTELQAFIGVTILSGVYRSKNESIESLWDDRTGRTIFQTIMTLGRFKSLSGIIRFDDHETTCARLQKDKLAPIRDVWDRWVDLLPRMYNPGLEVSVVDQLITFRGHCPFRQCVQRKTSRCGIKIWVVCDSRSGYAWNVQLDTGRAADGKAEKNQGMRGVLDMTKGLCGHNITCDSFFTSYALGKELLKRKLTMVGAIKQNKPELPPEVVNRKGRPMFSSRFAFTGTHALVSYVPRKNKNVLLMSTQHRNALVNGKMNKKPNIMLDYNRNKAGGDKLNRCIGAYTCKRKTGRWPLMVFFNMLDVSAYNAFVVWTEMNPDWNKSKNTNSRIFLEDLGKSLVSPLIERRKTVPHPYTSASSSMTSASASMTSASASMTSASASMTSASASMTSASASMTSASASMATAVMSPDANPNPSNNKRKRCKACYPKCNKTRIACQNCNTPVCKAHAVIINHCHSCTLQDLM